MVNASASKIILLFTPIIIFSFLILTAIGYKNNIYTSNFVDEEDNFTVAKYMLRGEKLYTDIFSHHQPIPYFISAGVQAVKQVDNINQLIKWHRYFMILWGVVWCIILFYKFRFFALPFIAIYELTKIYLLGHTFLAEAFIIYPLVYLLLSALVNKNIKRLEMLFIGVLAAFVILTLAPMLPLTVFLSSIILLKEKIRTNILLFFVGLLFVIAPIFSLISLKDYFYNAVYLNLFYYISPGDQPGIYKAFLSFIFLPFGDTAIFLKSIALVFLALILYSIFRHNKGIALIIFVTIGLANIRYSTGSFHLIPWYGLIVSAVGYLSVKYLTDNKTTRAGKNVICLMLLLLITLNFYLVKDRLFKNTDSKLEAYIHYSQQYDYGKAVEAMKADGDNLMVVPVEPLILWQADIKHGTKYPYYYTWMDNVPAIQNEVVRTFENNPPAFLYYDLNYVNYKSLSKYLNKYSNVKRNNKKTNLYILKIKVKKLNEDQLKKLQFFNFSVKV